MLCAISRRIPEMRSKIAMDPLIKFRQIFFSTLGIDLRSSFINISSSKLKLHGKQA